MKKIYEEFYFSHDNDAFFFMVMVPIYFPTVQAIPSSWTLDLTFISNKQEVTITLKSNFALHTSLDKTLHNSLFYRVTTLPEYFLKSQNYAEGLDKSEACMYRRVTEL